jgi:hypothetical protein
MYAAPTASDSRYRVRVRRRTFIWGGASVTKKLEAERIYLHFRVDENGEAVRFGVLKTPGGSLEEFGSLLPGESYTLKLDDIVGVFVAIDEPDDTFVDCALIATA